MFEILVAAAICLVVIGAWFLLPIESAEIILTAIIVLSATAAGIYWLWTGGSVTEVAESLGIFAFIVIILGVVRLGIERLCRNSTQHR